MRKTETVFIALGTNVGDCAANLQTAKALLRRKVAILQASSVYRTPPWGYTQQPDFLNQVIEVSTWLQPRALLRFLKRIEKKMGREKLILNGPRVIDLDIIFYGSRVLTSLDLQIPHPRMVGRAFVLVPLNEIAPDVIHPGLGISVQEMLTTVNTTGVILLGPFWLLRVYSCLVWPSGPGWGSGKRTRWSQSARRSVSAWRRSPCWRWRVLCSVFVFLLPWWQS